ncbi:hypothetical protein, partial [Oscillatoria sp. HE19RPO]|uniref:hypothetical protein n=1 Tax=Oscillatoria sp. HE19RPO TaxID=2954806 RepID=UPI0020C21CA9
MLTITDVARNPVSCPSPHSADRNPYQKSSKKTPRHNSGGFFQLITSCRLAELTRSRSNQERRISQDIPHRKVSQT